MICGFQWRGDEHICECASEYHGDDEFIAEIHRCECGDWTPRQRGEISYHEYRAIDAGFDENSEPPNEECPS